MVAFLERVKEVEEVQLVALWALYEELEAF